MFPFLLFYIKKIMTIDCHPRHLQDVLKTFFRRFQDVLKDKNLHISRNCYTEDFFKMFSRCVGDLKMYAEKVLDIWILKIWSIKITEITHAYLSLLVISQCSSCSFFFKKFLAKFCSMYQ